jgi:uncharacterized protein YjbK
LFRATGVVSGFLRFDREEYFDVEAYEVEVEDWDDWTAIIECPECKSELNGFLEKKYPGTSPYDAAKEFLLGGD